MTALRFHRVSTRARITAAAMVALAAVLGASAVSVYVLYSHNQHRAMNASARADATDIGKLVSKGPLPPTLPPISSGPFTLVQVLDGRGRPVSQSAGLTARTPIIDERSLNTASTSESFQIDGDATPEVTLTTVPITVGGARFTVAVVQSTADNRRALEALTLGLLIGMPTLVLLGGLFVWSAVGRALAPVEKMRLQAAAITATDLHLTIPQPPGGDNIAALAITLNAMLQRLRESSEEQRRFIGDASHELRSPITSILVALEVARDAAAGDDRELFIALLREQQRVADLVEQLLLLARIDSPAAVRHEGKTDLSDLAAKAAAEQSIPGIQISCDMTPNVLAEVDSELVQRIMRNILQNATHHAHSQILVTLRASTTDASFEVSDDGPGIQPADRVRVFDRFVRLDDSRERGTGGTGLGLAIVHEAVLAHSGTVTIGDAPFESGVTVTFTLPLERPGSPRIRP